jgi:hypothetical protein
MSDPATKLLSESATKTFTAAERARFRAMGAELAECYQTLGDFDGGRLAAQLEAAHAGLDASGAKIPDMTGRLARVASIQQAIAESAARIADARERERALFGEAKSPASRLLTAAIARADALLQNPPALPTPPALLEWGVHLDLPGHFLAVIGAAKQTLTADLHDDYGRRGSPEVGFHILTRGGLTEEK